MCSGEPIKLKCGGVESTLPVKTNWKHHDKFIDGEFEDSLSFIASVEKEGIYTCVITSSVGQVSSEGILVNVYEVPKIVSEPEDQTVITPNQINNASFICEVSGYPTPNISWHYQSFSENSHEEELPSKDPELILENITPTDSGFYFCRANNSHGAVKSRLAKLNVLASELPKQFIEMSVLVLINSPDNTGNTANNTNFNATQVYAEIIEKLRFSRLQNISYSVENQTLKSQEFHVKIESIFSADNITKLASMKEILKVALESRQNLANSAALFIDLMFFNHSEIYMSEYDFLLVDNTSLSYKANLSQCSPGYQIHKNGIVCGRNQIFFILTLYTTQETQDEVLVIIRYYSLVKKRIIFTQRFILSYSFLLIL